MQISKITFSEENISIRDAKKILEVYDLATDENYKRGLEEITPFRDFYHQNNLPGWIQYSILNIQAFLGIRKDIFRYKGVSFMIEQSEKDRIFTKGYIDGELKIIFKLKKGKKILIDKMISLEKGIGRRSIKELCEYHNTFSIIVKPSIYGRGFWEKMKIEYKNTINITIQ